jgi:polysaccharide pyruvyl transferase WcaK-like protein
MASVPQVASMMIGLHGWGGRAHLPHFEFAVGSSFPLGSTHGSDALTDADREYCRRLFAPPVWVSARDVVTASCLSDLGIEAALLPDIAFVMPGVRENSGSNIPRILVNLQRRGANGSYGRSDWDQARWEEFASKLIAALDDLGDVKLLANDAADAHFLQSLRPERSVVTPCSVDEYLDLVRTADLVVATRVHAAVASCSQGVPSVCLGNDSRLGVVQVLGVQAFDAAGTDLGEVMKSIERTLANSESLGELLARRKHEALRTFSNALWESVQASAS